MAVLDAPPVKGRLREQLGVGNASDIPLQIGETFAKGEMVVCLEKATRAIGAKYFKRMAGRDNVVRPLSSSAKSKLGGWADA